MQGHERLALPPLVKFPRTTHLFDAGGSATTADDLVLQDLNAVLSTFCDGTSSVVVEEKIDGANVGISIHPHTQEILIQNRSHYLGHGASEHAQFNRLRSEWVNIHRNALFSIFENNTNLILYGEWCAARHSIPYQRLPDLFIAFDIYDKEQGKFFSRERFYNALRGTGISVAPVLLRKTFSKSVSVTSFQNDIRDLLNTKSVFRNDGGYVEGIVLRIDSSPSLPANDEEHRCSSTTWLKHRYKVVRPDFVRGCQDGHWMKRKIEKQRVDYCFQQDYLQKCYETGI